MLDGILLVDKPAGMSSFAVVAQVRRRLSEQAGHKVKVGHTGTLDPFATGLLILVIGQATKRAGEFSKLDKTYEAELVLGKTSTTGDPEGEISNLSTHKPSEAQVKAALNKVTGQIQQVPPAFSAIKVGGRRAYKLARAGKTVTLEPRPVNIHSIKNVKYDYPKLSFVTEVSSGTYIRSLAEDIGKELSAGAYLSALRRTKVGVYEISQAKDLQKITKSDIIP